MGRARRIGRAVRVRLFDAGDERPRSFNSLRHASMRWSFL
jgi:hypothetical protein